MFDADAAPLDGLDPAGLLAVVESTHRGESKLVARRLGAVAALLRHRVAAAERSEQRADYASVDGFEQTSAEVAAAMNLSPVAANYVVSYAEALDTRLPKVAALLAQGRTDWRTVRLILSRTDLITDDGLIAEVDRSMAERIGSWHGWSKQRIVNAIDATVRAVDPDAARERRAAADSDRYLAVEARENGMSAVFGTVTATAASVFDRRLSQLATGVCQGDPRTMDQRRADALAALTEGRELVCGCGNPQCPRQSDAERPSGAARVVINVVASDHTVYGGGSAPGYLQGHGVIDAEQVRELVATAALHVLDPVTSPAQALCYQPPAALERAVRCRDLTCRFPGCSRSAEFCDLDHTIPFNHQDPASGGLTVYVNLKCLCRFHHRLKTFGGWRDRQLADGTIVWTSPSGRTYRTSPGGADLFPLPRGPACAGPPPRRPNRSRSRARRITQARRQNHEQRPINEARRRLERARANEIEARKFRNHLRDTLFAFKGTPSTSPFCRWVNDPREPEELPDDWTPDEPPPDPLPDDPPF
ncbi:HNH endonuclease signature motif containing protein [Mycobacterium sp. 050134]|uniref:HNH endonuclease signature motif containing protein n=1 Tax=Mycobacterium sp. 050134 TaxID=3096111 RepID=UPI002ED9D60C